MSPMLRRVEMMAAVLGTMASLVVLQGWGLGRALGVVAGAVLAIVNFRLLRSVMGRLILGDSADIGKMVTFAALAGLKLLGLLGGVAVALVWLRLDVIGFAVGISMLVLAIVGSALISREPSALRSVGGP